MSDTSDSSYPPPPPPTAPTVPANHRHEKRRSMVLRHLVSAAVALVLTPIGIVLFDIGATRYRTLQLVALDDGGNVPELLVMGIGLLLLLAAAACGRVSGLGPLLAGLVWGVVPAVWVYADAIGFYEVVLELPTVWDHSNWFGVASYLFPLVAALLLGAAVAGRWAGRKP
ncbi:hypothetical protein [Nocardioides antri]|uniref:Uncharacterized protein n=1 Tax=Nocardioides antri TaxID=2607659 RepID=A0A5B1LZH3_9ACTN|nr:hypothetical protein [Nocardioides antri]KAA1426052.1 hypothetical protein F0U47_17105 [Nocardioides antri]